MAGGATAAAPPFWEMIRHWAWATLLLTVQIFFIMMALLLFLELLKVFGWIHPLVRALTPFLRLMGLDEKVGFLWMTAVILGLSYGGAIIVEEAKSGHLSRDGKQADLYDNVQVRRAASGTQEEMLAVTDRLTILPDDEKAFTKSPVLITQGKSWLKGVGLQIDNSKQTYLLESQAVGQFESQHAKKR